ncbi:MAG: carbonic anhydrase [Polyangiaceae bacterium]|nr:carbonic anhydrase [Polyangiaceae bacterium]
MKKLLQGIVDYRNHVLPDYRERYAALAGGQSPDSLFISCSDSRVEPSLVASSDPGDLFVMRNAGNLVPIAHASGHSTGDESEAAGIEYALLALGVTDIVVCGHSSCGAMKAVLDGKLPPNTPNLEAWLRHGVPALDMLRAKGPIDASRPEHDQLSQWNVLVQLEHVRSYPIVQEFLTKNAIRLTALWFEIASGIVYAFDEEERKYQEICGDFARKLLARYDLH